jgi:hypothetical protein
MPRRKPVCSTCNAQWAYHDGGVDFGRLAATAAGRPGAVTGGCDRIRNAAGTRCDPAADRRPTTLFCWSSLVGWGCAVLFMGERALFGFGGAAGKEVA